VELWSDLAYRQEDVRIPGAIHIPPAEFDLRNEEIPKGLPVVMYCARPNEATSARMALLLKSNGFKEVWPQLGGLEAWVERGYPTETLGVGEALADRIPDAGVLELKEQDNSWA